MERREQKDSGHVLGESHQNLLVIGWKGKGRTATEGDP